MLFGKWEQLSKRSEIEVTKRKALRSFKVDN